MHFHKQANYLKIQDLYSGDQYGLSVVTQTGGQYGISEVT